MNDNADLLLAVKYLICFILLFILIGKVNLQETYLLYKDSIISIVSTAFGFSLFYIWDKIKYKNNKSNKDQNTLRVIKSELAENAVIIKNNLDWMSSGENAMDENMTIVTPMCKLNLSFWDIIKLNFPEDIVNNKDLFPALCKVHTIASQINQAIEIREAFRIGRITDENKPAYNKRLKAYNDLIAEPSDRMLKAIEIIDKLLK